MLRSEHGLPTTAMATSPTEPTLELNLQHQLSLESSSSMLGTSMLHSLPSGNGTQLPSPRYVRSSTSPLPGSLRASGPGSLAAAVSAAEQGPQHNPSQAAAGTLKGRPSVLHDLESEEEEECDLVHPMSPAAVAAAEGPEHCHWEDGVIASWLQGIDHSELLHDGQEEEEEAAPQPATAAAGGASGKGAAATGIQQSSSVPSTVLYSSLLYK
jgi:hypothetical protein